MIYFLKLIIRILEYTINILNFLLLSYIINISFSFFDIVFLLSAFRGYKDIEGISWLVISKEFMAKMKLYYKIHIHQLGFMWPHHFAYIFSYFFQRVIFDLFHISSKRIFTFFPINFDPLFCKLS